MPDSTPEEVLREALGSARLAHRGLWRAVRDREPSGIIQGYEEKFRSDHERALAALDQLLQEWDGQKDEPTWADWTAWLDRHYPRAIFTGESGDEGPQTVALARHLRDAEARIRELEAERDRADERARVQHEWAKDYKDQAARLRADLADLRDRLAEEAGPAGDGSSDGEPFYSLWRTAAAALSHQGEPTEGEHEKTHALARLVAHNPIHHARGDDLHSHD